MQSHVGEFFLVLTAMIWGSGFVASALQTVGLQYATPSKNAFLTVVNVVIVPFIAFIIYRRISFHEVVGAIMTIISVGVISLNFPYEMNFGDFLTLLCAVAFAFQIFYTAVLWKRKILFN